MRLCLGAGLIGRFAGREVGNWKFEIGDFRRQGDGVYFAFSGRVAESGLRHSTRNRALG